MCLGLGARGLWQVSFDFGRPGRCLGLQGAEGRSFPQTRALPLHRALQDQRGNQAQSGLPFPAAGAPAHSEVPRAPEAGRSGGWTRPPWCGAEAARLHEEDSALGGVRAAHDARGLWLQSQPSSPAPLTRTLPVPLPATGQAAWAGRCALCTDWVPEKQGPPGGGVGCTGSRGEAAGGPGCERVRRALLWADVLEAPPPEPVRMSSRWPESCGIRRPFPAQMNRRVPTTSSSQMAPRRCLARQPFAHLLGPHLWGPKANGGRRLLGRLLAPLRVSFAHCYLCKKACMRETLLQAVPQLPLFTQTQAPCMQPSFLPSPPPGPAGSMRARPAVPSPTPQLSRGCPRASRFPPAPGPLRCHLETAPTPDPQHVHVPPFPGSAGGLVAKCPRRTWTPTHPTSARPSEPCPSHRLTLRPPHCPSCDSWGTA